jgi:hypothetical protein
MVYASSPDSDKALAHHALHRLSFAHGLPFPFCKPTAAGAGGTAADGESMVKLGGLFFKGGIHSYTSTVYCLTPTKADMNSI